MGTLFDDNRFVVTQIPNVVAAYRCQSYFHASNGMKEITEVVSYIVTALEEIDTQRVYINELCTILGEILNAQEANDYCYLADILEGDLLNCLQRLQIELQNGTNPAFSYLDTNLQKLDDISRRILDKYEIGEGYGVQYAINGSPILYKVYDNKVVHFHSSINPEAEARKLATEVLQKHCERYVIFGFGFGYYVKALLDIDPTCRVTVIENDIGIVKLALSYVDFSKYLGARLELKFGENYAKYISDSISDTNNTYFGIHYPSLQCLENKEVKQLLEDYFVNDSSVKEHIFSLTCNFNYLSRQNLPNATELLQKFKGRTVVVVAGGPSVDDDIEMLKVHREELAIIAVGRIVKKLLEDGITPDAFTITDPQEIILTQIEGIEQSRIPLILLSTSYFDLANKYGGPIYIAFQEGFEAAEKKAREQDEILFETGGSVTTFAIDFAIRMGAERIILSGADFAYTNGLTHSTGTGGKRVEDPSLRQVQSTTGDLVYTIKNLDIYRKWTEKRIAKSDAPAVYNTSKGARIAGTIECSIDEAISR